MPRTLAPWRPSRILLATLILVLVLVGLLYTGFELHDTAYEPSVVHQAVEAVEHVASEVAQQQETTQSHVPFGDHMKDASPPQYGEDAFCKVFPDPGNLAVIIKTGATELHNKLPTALATSLRCVRKPLIFSDMAQRLGKHEVHNALANFTPSAMEGNKDFDIYRKQNEYVAGGREADLPELSSIPIPSDDWRTVGKSAAWALDKYKWLHMVEQTWKLAPNRDWYFFLEADTYLSWPNLLRWLETLDPKQGLYYGNAVRVWEYPVELYFGHGGSGVLLSGAAVKEFAVAHRGIAKRWDKRVHKMWYGDYVLAAALFEELRLRLTDARPSLTADDPSLVTFSEEKWCSPILTLHHFKSQQLNDLFQYERKRNGSELLYRDVFQGTYPEGLPANLTDWENMPMEEEFSIEVSSNASGDMLKDPHGSRENCERACVSNQQCLQFMYIKSNGTASEGETETESKCHLSSAIKLGAEKQPEDEKGTRKQWSSGWMKDRLARWIEEHQSCLIGSIAWPLQ